MVHWPAVPSRWRGVGIHRGKASGQVMWRLWFTRGNIIGGMIAVIIVGALVFILAEYPKGMWHANAGFGPEWHCTYPGQGDPICLRKQPSN